MPDKPWDTENQEVVPPEVFDHPFDPLPRTAPLNRADFDSDSGGTMVDVTRDSTGVTITAHFGGANLNDLDIVSNGEAVTITRKRQVDFDDYAPLGHS